MIAIHVKYFFAHRSWFAEMCFSSTQEVPRLWYSFSTVLRQVLLRANCLSVILEEWVPLHGVTSNESAVPP